MRCRCRAIVDHQVRLGTSRSGRLLYAQRGKWPVTFDRLGSQHFTFRGGWLAGCLLCKVWQGDARLAINDVSGLLPFAFCRWTGLADGRIATISSSLQGGAGSWH